MKIELNDQDAAQVRAILLTHAEMQDQHAIQNEELRGRLTKDQVDDDLLSDLEEVHEDLSADTKNLKRIADIFVG